MTASMVIVYLVALFTSYFAGLKFGSMSKFIHKLGSSV